MKKYILYLLLAFATIANAQIITPEKGTLQFVRNSEVRSTGAMIDSLHRDFILSSSYLDTATFVRKNLMTDENGNKDFIAETKTHFTIVDVPSLPMMESVYGELQGFDCEGIANINNNNLLLKNGSMEGYIMLPTNPDFGELHLYFDSTSTSNTLYVIAPSGDKIRHWSSATGLIENFPIVEIAQEYCYSIHFKRVENTWYMTKEYQGAYIYDANIGNMNVNKLIAANPTQGQVLSYQASTSRFEPTTIAAPTLSLSGQDLSISGGNTVTLPTSSGGGLQYFTEATTTTTANTNSLTPNSVLTNVGVALKTKGQGALTLSIPDGTITGGNARGINAIDLQMTRTAATQVPTGTNAFALGATNTVTAQSSGAVGLGNTVGGQASYVFGLSNTVSASGSLAIGRENIVSSVFSYALGYQNSISALNSNAIGYVNTVTAPSATAIGHFARATTSGVSLSNGTGGNGITCQTVVQQLKNITNGTAQIELFTDGTALRRLLLPGGYNSRIQIVVTVRTAGGTVAIGDAYFYTYDHFCKMVGATTTDFGATLIANGGNASLSGGSITILADDTTDALSIKYTPPAGAVGSQINVNASLITGQLGI